MGKLVVLVLLAAAVYGGARHFGFVGRTLEVQGLGPGQSVVAELDGSKVTFTVAGPAEETYMLFGGEVRGSSHAWLAGIELATARRIAKRHPDFHRCDSPGAAEAKDQVESLQTLADRPTLAKVEAALQDFEARMKGGGERLCTTLRGQWLALEKLESRGVVMTAEEWRERGGGPSKGYTLYLQEIDARDCKGAL